MPLLNGFILIEAHPSTQYSDDAVHLVGDMVQIYSTLTVPLVNAFKVQIILEKP